MILIIMFVSIILFMVFLLRSIDTIVNSPEETTVKMILFVLTGVFLALSVYMALCAIYG